jgi:hypothetical protein
METNWLDPEPWERHSVFHFLPSIVMERGAHQQAHCLPQELPSTLMPPRSKMLPHYRRIPLKRHIPPLATVMKNTFWQLIYSRAGWIGTSLGKIVGAILVTKGLVDDPNTPIAESGIPFEAIVGGVVTMVALLFDGIVKWREHSTIKRTQEKLGTEADGYPGPETLKRLGILLLFCVPFLTIGCSSFDPEGKVSGAAKAVAANYDVRPGIVPTVTLDGRLGYAGPLIVVPKKASSADTGKNPTDEIPMEIFDGQ